ncbi:MAG: hypothetical protein GTO18_21375 [Anaerolineales bacterium]|nr:hypothetical protein [Anaerolineales bacterium]
MGITGKRWVLPLGVVCVLILAACNFPSLQPTEDQFATAAAETVAAQLTEVSEYTPAPVSNTSTPEPTSESPTTEAQASETPQPTSSPTEEECTDKVGTIVDVTVPDDTRMDPGESFLKIWRIENAGTCPWTTDYIVRFDSGNIMGGSANIPLPHPVAPGGDVDIEANFTAPSTNGPHQGNWKFRNDQGLLFGWGANADQAFWVRIIVGPTPTPKPVTVYDFTDNYCSANWVSGAGVLPCPGTDTDTEGFVIKLDTPKFENGATENEPALETHPEWVNNGVISGRFPAFDVVEGDHLKTVIGCMYKSGGSDCDVKYQITYYADGGPLQLLGEWTETYDSMIRVIDIDLAAAGLAGKSVEFALVVQAHGSSSQDWALWLLPRIEGPPR